jgi:hypothetical protein
MTASKKPKKLANRKGPEAPRGLNVRGLPRYVLDYLEERAGDLTLSTEAYVRTRIIEHVDRKLAGPD